LAGEFKKVFNPSSPLRQFPAMLTESFIASIATSIHVKAASATVPIVKDAAIYTFNLHPQLAQTGVLKKSTTGPNALAVSDSHIFAAQADKAVVNVYGRERGNHEATIPFKEKVSVVAVAGDHGELLAMGTEGGDILVWEVSYFEKEML
jgi:pre-rRNA-processing protein IPI3